MHPDFLHTTVAEALAVDPACARVFLAHGMACVGCPMARFETIEEAARSYGLEPAALAAALQSGPKGKH